MGLGYFDEVTGGVFEECLPDGCAWDVDWVVYFDVVFSEVGDGVVDVVYLDREVLPFGGGPAVYLDEVYFAASWCC